MLISHDQPVLYATEYRTLLDITVDCLDRPSSATIGSALQKLQEMVGFDAAIATQMRADIDKSPITRYINHGYHPEWLSIYQKNRYQLIDPVVRYGLKATGSYSWEQAFTAFHDSCPATFLQEAGEYGLHSGIACCCRPGQEGQAYTYLSIANVVSGREAVAHYSANALVAALRHAFPQLDSSKVSAGDGVLTDKEHEVIKWAAVGNNTQAIADRLNITERTVKFHLGNIYQKLGAANRAQAIAEALRRNLV